MYEIVGRDEELASLQAFVGRADGEPVALVLDMLRNEDPSVVAETITVRLLPQGATRRIEEPALDGCPA